MTLIVKSPRRVILHVHLFTASVIRRITASECTYMCLCVNLCVFADAYKGRDMCVCLPLKRTWNSTEKVETKVTIFN
jgi:hypothetical protein